MRWISVVALAIVLLSPQSAPAQATGTIAGTVTGTGGRPISGANVLVQGTTRTARTAADGRYTITAVPAGARVVRANFAGYAEATRAVTVAAGQTATANIALTAQVVQLEGVVATGYATQRRQDVTGAVATLQTENIQSLPVAGATQALVAQVPGVNVITSTGAPGSGAQVQIRGVSAVGAGSTPLYVVDGFPITGTASGGGNTDGGGQIGFTSRNPLNDIPPNDIESITVLKDASAAAIYGSRASNGVVIITTKRGRAAEGTRIDVNAYTGYQRADMSRFPELANGPEFAAFMLRRARQRASQGLSLDARNLEGVPDTMQFVNAIRNNFSTNWFEEVMQDAPTTNVSVSLSGGSERVRSYFSAGFLNQEGIVRNTGYDRFSLRANFEADLSERISVTLNVAPTYSTRRLGAAGGTNRGGGFGQSMIAWPTDPARAAEGDTLLRRVHGGTNITAGPWIANPVIQLEDVDNQAQTMRAFGSAAFNWELIDGLAFRSSLNVDWQDNDSKNFVPSTVYTNNSGIPRIPEGDFRTTGYMSWLNENTLTLDRNFGDAHRLQLLGGLTAQTENSSGTNIQARQYPNDDIRTPNGATQITVNNVDEEEWSLASAFGRLNYTLLDRYVLTATIRADGSSRFGQDRRWGSFPSAAVAWNVSQEPFMEDVTFVQDLKARVSLGFTGNNQIGNYPSFGRISQADYLFSGSQFAGRVLGTLGNPDLGWERTQELNVGLEASFLDRRAALTFDVYRRKTEDLLLSLELPAASGHTSVTANQGSIQNEGLEVGLNTNNIDTRNFRWTSNINFSTNRNKALDLGASDTLWSGASMEGGSNTHITIVGQPVGLFVGYKLLGLLDPNEIRDPSVAKRPGAQVTDPQFLDANGDGTIRQREDFVIIGSPYPDFTWGFTNNLTYGPVDLRFTLDGAVGGQRLDRNLASTENIDGIFNVTKEYVENMWISPDSTPNYDDHLPSPWLSSAQGRRDFRDVHDRWVQDADYVWMRNITLRYNLPTSLPINARNASVYLGVQNPWVWTAFNGNPQTETGQTLSTNGSPSSPNLTPGVDNFSYPLARTFTIGVDLGL